MGIYLCEAASCECQGAYGWEPNHQIGDQKNGEEVRTIAYYNYPWTYAWRCKSESCAKAIAVRQKQAADRNPYVGYGQKTRLMYLEALKKIPNYDPSKLTETVDCDCSSLTNANVYLTLLSVGVKTQINGTEVTAQMPSVYEGNAMFTNITNQVNLVTGEGLKAGDIVCSPGHHVAVVWITEDAKKQTTGTVTTDLYLREGTVTNGKLATGKAICVMPTNSVVTINSEIQTVAGATWYNVTWHGATGWASSKYITK